MKMKFLTAMAALSLTAAVSIPAFAEDTDHPYIPSGIEYAGGTDACDVNVGLIMGPPSMGMGWFINEAKEGNTYNNFNFEVGGVDYTALASKFNTGDYDIIHCPSNVGAILYNNTDLKEEAVVADIGNLGLLYIMTTDPVRAVHAGFTGQECLFHRGRRTAGIHDGLSAGAGRSDRCQYVF